MYVMSRINYKRYLLYFLIILIVFTAFNEVVFAYTGFDVDFDLDSGGSSLFLYLIMYILFSFVRVFSFNTTILQFFAVITTVGLVVFLFLELFNFKVTKTVSNTKPKEKTYSIIYEDDILKEKKQKNIISDIKIYCIFFSKVEISDNKVSITIAYDLTQRDYIVNYKNLIVRGTDKRQDIVSLVTFVKSESKKKLTKCLLVELL